MFGFMNTIKTVAGRVTFRQVVLFGIALTYGAMAMGWVSKDVAEEVLRALKSLLAL